jgi:hypothetical protein
MRTLALLAFSFSFIGPAHASNQTSQEVQRTLDTAILLAGPSLTGLPIALAPAPPDEASRGVEAWTLSHQDGHGERIIVYSGSGVFHCASDPNRQDYQCLLKLASILVHEAWHYRHGPDEAGAYDAQISFLTTHGRSGARIGGVRRSRDRVLAAQQAIEKRRR